MHNRTHCIRCTSGLFVSLFAAFLLIGCQSNKDSGTTTTTPETKAPSAAKASPAAATLSPPAAAEPSLPAASKSGEERQRQEYPIALLAVNARLLQGVIYDIIHENLLLINLSYLMPDLKRLNEILSLQAEEIIRKFLQAEKHAV